MERAKEARSKIKLLPHVHWIDTFARSAPRSCKVDNRHAGEIGNIGQPLPDASDVDNVRCIRESIAIVGCRLFLQMENYSGTGGVEEGGGGEGGGSIRSAAQ